mmetsp:Transcript_14990/g.45892  ORF Transcript_14990/g.45892 Transcript_14990/m.45892 type:complete len:242 (-) Transcript_14990:628-1353(-)
MRAWRMLRGMEPARALLAVVSRGSGAGAGAPAAAAAGAVAAAGQTLGPRATRTSAASCPGVWDTSRLAPIVVATVMAMSSGVAVAVASAGSSASSAPCAGSAGSAGPWAVASTPPLAACASERASSTGSARGVAASASRRKSRAWAAAGTPMAPSSCAYASSVGSARGVTASASGAEPLAPDTSSFARPPLTPVPASCSISSMSRKRPKSAILAVVPSSEMRMFSGLRSRCAITAPSDPWR